VREITAIFDTRATSGEAGGHFGEGLARVIEAVHAAARALEIHDVELLV